MCDKHGIISSQVVDLFPKSRFESDGVLKAGTEEYLVNVLYERGKRLRAQITIADVISNESRRRSSFYEFTRRGMIDEAWAPLCVDASDGKTIYSMTLTTCITSTALDRFLESAQVFLENNSKEIIEIVRGDGESEGFDRGIDSKALSALLGIDI